MFKECENFKQIESLGIIDLNQKLCLDNERTMKKVGNLLRSVGGNAKLNEPSNVIDIPYEYIDYVIYNYNITLCPKKHWKRCLHIISLVLRILVINLSETYGFSLKAKLTALSKLL